jgi:hypothetical protein
MQKEYELLDFSPEFSEAFKELNLEWIEAYFEPEDIDLKMLSDPQKIFIDSGGAIVFAKVGEDIVGCCGLLKHNDTSVRNFENGCYICPSGARVGQSNVAPNSEDCKTAGSDST